jgi:hypothetical protein
LDERINKQKILILAKRLKERKDVAVELATEHLIAQNNGMICEKNN